MAISPRVKAEKSRRRRSKVFLRFGLPVFGLPVFGLLACLGATLCLGRPGAAVSDPGPPPLPLLAQAQCRNATVLPVPDGIKVTFQPAEWPSVFWSAGTKAWDWNGSSLLALELTNPSRKALTLSVRIDDDAEADGVSHCRTAWAALAPGQTGVFFVDLAAANPPQAEGMRGSPPFPGCEQMHPMTANGTIVPSHITGFQIFMHHPAAPCSLVIARLRLISSLTTSRRYSQLTDAYGQFTRGDWPGKLHSPNEFQSRRSAEATEIAQAPLLPGRDLYGGWQDGPHLPPTGYFTTVQCAGRWWLVTPGGHLFLSLGVNEVSFAETTRVHSREELFTWLPAPGSPLSESYGEGGKTFGFYRANIARKYGSDSPNEWRVNAVARLNHWGFNTLGNWSSETLEAEHHLPYTATLSVEGGGARLPAGSSGNSSMRDPFDPQFARACAASFRAKASHLRLDPWCLGCFVDNELPWNGDAWTGNGAKTEPDTLALEALAAPHGQPAKRAFQRQLQAKYGAVANFNRAWGASLGSWDDFDAPFHLAFAPSAACRADRTEFVYRFALRYFTVVCETLHQFDPHHLYLGCRFAGRNAAAERAAAAVCDVVSFNVYEPRLEPAAWASVQRLSKPCLVSEFQFGAQDRGMFAGGLVPALSQAQRAVMYRDYVNSVLDNPAFVGVHWYKYADEPLTGRSLDGENSNIGFVSVTDTPYPEMTTASRQTLATAYARHLGLSAAP